MFNTLGQGAQTGPTSNFEHSTSNIGFAAHRVTTQSCPGRREETDSVRGVRQDGHDEAWPSSEECVDLLLWKDVTPHGTEPSFCSGRTDDRRQTKTPLERPKVASQFLPFAPSRPWRENNPPPKRPKIAHHSPICVFFPLRLLRPLRFESLFSDFANPASDAGRLRFENRREVRGGTRLASKDPEGLSYAPHFGVLDGITE